MDQTVVECVVVREPATWKRALYYAFMIMTGCGVLLTLVFPFFFLSLVVSGLGLFMTKRSLSVEFEYLYFDGVLTIDKVTGQTSRKHLKNYYLDKLKMIAPEDSDRIQHLSRTAEKKLNYGNGSPLPQYVMFYNNQKVIFSPSQELLTALKKAAPNQVFID